MLQRIPLDVYNVTDPSMQLQYYPRNPIAFKLLLCAEYIDLHDSYILDSVQMRESKCDVIAGCIIKCIMLYYQGIMVKILQY